MKDDLSYQSLIKTVPTFTESLERCYLLGGLRAQEAAFKLNIKYSQFQRMMNPNDSSHFNPDLIEQHMRNCGNLFPLDYLENRMGRQAFPLDQIQIFSEIARALREDGKTVNFALKALLGRGF